MLRGTVGFINRPMHGNCSATNGQALSGKWELLVDRKLRAHRNKEAKTQAYADNLRHEVAEAVLIGEWKT